jgi:hypothetical protein
MVNMTFTIHIGSMVVGIVIGMVLSLFIGAFALGSDGGDDYY